jgi:DNA segregation ATPase FtsK/SpoIIIE, S-DNA-T family
LPGQIVADFSDKADDFAHELGARSCRAFAHPRVRGVFRRHPAVRLELGFGPDPLEEMVSAFPIPERPEDVDLSAIPVGLTEHGEIWTVPLLGSHLFVAGLTGSGKGSILWSLLRGIAPLIRNGCVRVWGFDPKGGVELNMGHDPHDLFYRYCDGEIQEHADMLSDAVTAMKDQLAWLKTAPVDGDDELFGIRKLSQPAPEHPLNLIVVDEFADLAAKQETPDLTKQLDSATRQLVNKGRAPGFPMVVFVQNPTAETSKHRNELQVRSVALALQGGRVRTDMVLGDGAYESGAKCDEIDPVVMPGVGFARMPGVPAPVRVRAAYVSDAEIREMARDYAPSSSLAS